MTGESIAHYRIGPQIGEGGMGQVYRATDTKLRREVALKLLPAAFTEDAERLERFRGEARALAAFSHPNIGAIYGIEESDGRVALVLELIEGETLADRLDAGPMSLAEAIPVATQIATALEAAHARGIVHRDLKPANIKITPAGQVKVLDFGLAKSAERAAAGAADVTRSPTALMTAAIPGLIMGTAAYMSPEQAKGQPVDRRADIWAYGAVLFEMVTGRRLFDGDDITEVLAAVISREPDLSRLPAALPLWFRDLVSRCLRRDLTMRLPDIAAARIALIEADDHDAQVAGAPTPASSLPIWILVGAALVVGAGAGALGARLLLTAPPAELATTYAEIVFTPPPKPGAQMAISQDGLMVAYAGGDVNDAKMIYLRSLANGTTRPLPGSEHGDQPVFSPDGNSVAFFSAGRVRVGDLGGALPEAITAVAGTIEGLVWLPDDTIVYSTTGSRLPQRVPTTGGTSQPVQVRGATEDLWIGSISRLPDPDTLLVSVQRGTQGGAIVAALSLRDGALTEIAAGSNPRFVSPSTLVFLQRNALVAAPFDPSSLSFTGPVRALDPPGISLITTSRPTGDRFSGGVSEAGRALFPIGQAEQRELVWVDRAGVATSTGFVFDSGNRLAFATNGALGASLSPDGERVALIADTPQVVDLADVGQRRVLPSVGSSVAYPHWDPDGEHVVVVANASGSYQSYRLAAAGTSPPQQLTRQPQSIALSFFPDGTSLLGYIVDPQTSRDLWIFGLDGTDTPVLQTPANERAPSVSPDGRAFVYVSDESGEDRVYMRQFPDTGQAWPISGDHATAPRWSRDGREIFFLQGNQMMAASVDLSDGVRTGTPRQLFAIGGYEQDPFGVPMYDVAADGRFLMGRIGTGGHTWRWIQNWGTDLARLGEER